MRRRWLVVTFAAGQLANSGPAMASTPWHDCGDGGAPAPYDEKLCAPVFEIYPVCSTNNGVGFCSVAGFSTDFDGEITIVSHYSGGADEFVAWGLTTDGDRFCCAWEESGGHELSEVEVMGSAGDDAMAAYYGSTETFYNPGGGDLTLVMFSYGGDDDLRGPHVAFGYPGLTVEFYASTGDDTLSSNVAATFHGEAGSDSIVASDGPDLVYGDATTGTQGVDVISARGGVDTVDAGGSNDAVCAGDDEDAVLGGTGDDDLWGGADADVIDGGTGTNHCGQASDTRTNCTSLPLGSPPLSCP